MGLAIYAEGPRPQDVRFILNGEDVTKDLAVSNVIIRVDANEPLTATLDVYLEGLFRPEAPEPIFELTTEYLNSLQQVKDWQGELRTKQARIAVEISRLTVLHDAQGTQLLNLLEDWV